MLARTATTHASTTTTPPLPPDCVPLHSLRQHLARMVDVAVVVVAAAPAPQRTRTRQFAMTFTVTDPTVVVAVGEDINMDDNNNSCSSSNNVVEVHLFRAHKNSLPTFGPGDGLLLRRFEVVALAGRGFGLLSRGESAYAVLGATGDGEEGGGGRHGSRHGRAASDIQVNGPPVEDMDREAAYIHELRRWYAQLGDQERARVAAADGAFAARRGRGDQG